MKPWSGGIFKMSAVTSCPGAEAEEVNSGLGVVFDAEFTRWQLKQVWNEWKACSYCATRTEYQVSNVETSSECSSQVELCCTSFHCQIASDHRIPRVLHFALRRQKFLHCLHQCTPKKFHDDSESVSIPFSQTVLSVFWNSYHVCRAIQKQHSSLWGHTAVQANRRTWWQSKRCIYRHLGISTNVFLFTGTDQLKIVSSFVADMRTVLWPITCPIISISPAPM